MKRLIFILVLIIFPFKVYGLCESSNSCILIDIDSGRILYEKDVSKQLLIASTTKLMTFLIAYENGNLDDSFKVGEEVLEMYGTSIYLSLNEEMSLKDLLYGLILRSGNDASVVIANNIGNSYDDFVEMMNEKAKVLGMKNTIFKNPHGLDEETENYSTSYDMALLISYLSKIDFFMEVASTIHYETNTSLKSYDWYNRNKLLTEYEYTTSGKNGYTPKAGKTLVSTASKNNLNLASVSLDDPNIYDTHISLYEYGFSNYSNYLIVSKDNLQSIDNLYDGELYIESDFYYPLTEEEKDKIETIIQIRRNVDIDKTNVVGDVFVYLDNDEIYHENIYLKKNEVKESFFEKIWRYIKNIFIEKDN